MNLLSTYSTVRSRTESICEPLQTEDYVVQPIVDVSPPKWHLGHTTWFFEQFVLVTHYPNYKVFDDDFGFVFNSYYEAVGKRLVRSNRGNLSRPSVKEVYAYRAYVDEKMLEFINSTQNKHKALIELGLNHEQQHQELLLTDIKYILGNNPLLPKYGNFNESVVQDFKQNWIAIDEGLFNIGYEGEGFHYDNEEAKHKVFLEKFEISNKLVTNREYLEFIEDGGYERFDLWHSEGWEWVQQLENKCPMYWHKESKWMRYGLGGYKELELDTPLSHISYYEAYAFAQWKGMRLPTEFEWEVANSKFEWGQRWEWTESAYLPYPRYKKVEGAIGEYNGKFMVNQKVLRGASVATAEGHSRPTYRNFFHPNLRWQYTGIRLARNIES